MADAGRSWLSRVLNLEPGETGKLLFLWTLYLLLTSATQVGDGVAQTLFLKRIGASYLPMMFAVKAVLDILVALIYVPLAARLGHPATLTLALGLAGAGLLALWLPAQQGSVLAYPAIYAWNETAATLIKIHWGVLLLDCFSPADARRTFPVVYTGARVGAVLGGLTLTLLARSLGAQNLLPVAAGIFLLAAVLAVRVRRLTVDGGDPALVRESAAGRISHIKHGLGLGLRVPLLRAIAASTMLMVVCRYGLRYSYSATFAASFTEPGLAQFYGSYMALANAGSIVVQIVITSRLLVSGITRTNLSYAAAILAAFGALWLRPGLSTAVVARLVDNELKSAIKTPLSNLFYGALEPAQRAAGRAFILGLVVPLATAGASLLLFWGPALRQLLLWGTALAVLFVGATWAQNRAYDRTTSRGH